MEQSINQLISTITDGLFMLLLAAVSYGVKIAFEYLKAKANSIKNEDQKNIINSTLSRLESMVYTGVKATEVSIGAELRQSVKDGKVDRSELLALKDVVVNEVLAGMNDDMKNTIELGVGDIDIYISQLVETALADVKNKLV